MLTDIMQLLKEIQMSKRDQTENVKCIESVFHQNYEVSF